MEKTVVLLLLLLLLSPLAAFAADPAKIAVAAEGNAPSSQVSSVAARCSYFLLFDEKGTFVEVVANPHKDTPRRAASQVVDFLACQDANVVIAGTFGEKMIASMQARGMRYLEFKGSADDAVKKALEK